MGNLYDLPLDIIEKLLLETSCLNLMLVNKEMYRKVSYIKKIYEYKFTEIYKKWKHSKKALIEKLSSKGHINKLIFLIKNYRFKYSNVWIIKNASLMSRDNILNWCIKNLDLSNDDYKCMIEYSIMGKNLKFINQLDYEYKNDDYFDVLKISSKIGYYDCIIWSLTNLCKNDTKISEIENYLLEVIKNCTNQEIYNVVTLLIKYSNDMSFILGVLTYKDDDFFNDILPLFENINYRKTLLISSSYAKINNFKYLYYKSDKDDDLITAMISYAAYSYNKDILEFLITNNPDVVDYQTIAYYASCGGHIEIIQFALSNHELNIESIASLAIIYGRINVLMWILNNFTINDFDSLLTNALSSNKSDVIKFLLYYMQLNKIKLNNKETLLITSINRNYKSIYKILSKMD